ncbi:MAG: peptidoglycan editing factor PgeF [Gammaproteobacteria bacterium]
MSPRRSVITLDDWPRPANIRAAFTTRIAGKSLPPYASFNLATHVGDDDRRVTANRQTLVQQLALPGEPLWLNQIHGATVADAFASPNLPAADASYGAAPGAVCAVLSADCLPILIASEDGIEIAAVHAGWRGLLGKVVEAVLTRFRMPPAGLSAWLGPRISARHYEVGPDLIENFSTADNRYATAFSQHGHQSYLDLGAIARLQLESLGVVEIHDCELCTYENAHEFYSYRRDGVTGRFASLIWRMH